MRNLKVLFNTEGNHYLGMGHIYECIRLGNKFKEKYNTNILYLLSQDSEPGVKKIQEFGYPIRTVKRGNFDNYLKEIKEFNPHIIINDVLYIKEEYMRKLRNLDSLIVSMEHIEKTPNHEYADIIFNSLYPPNDDIKGKYYFGPSYISLNDSFRDLPKKKVNKECKDFFICFGGSDTNGFTLKSIKALNNFDGVHATVLLGPSFKHHHELEVLMKKVDQNKFILLNNVQDSAFYMVKADIGLVSGGHTICELAATGTPGITICQNEMEVRRAKLFSEYYGIIFNLGNGKELSIDNLISHMRIFIDDYKLRKKLSEKGQELIDGKSSDRIIKIIMENLKS